MHALVSDPGGVLHVRHNTYTTAAFRRMKSVGFLPHERDYPNDHNYTYFGAQYTACILASPGSRLPLRDLPARAQLLTCRLRFGQVGLSRVSPEAPTG